MTPLVLALLLFVVGVALVTALARNVLVATVVFAAYSLGLAILWVVYRAPDVGLTEAAVGAGVATSLFLVALRATGPAASDRTFDRRPDPGALAVTRAFVLALCLTVPALPAVGAPNAPAATGASRYYLENAGGLGIDNVVTAVLVVYRGFDTFGEVAVVFAAAVAVLVVFRKEVP